MTSDEFIKSSIEGVQYKGFWDVASKRLLIRGLESNFNTNILRDLYIDDIIMNGDNVLINWKKRLRPLTDDELKGQYGREV